MAPAWGIEPQSTGLEAVVLPLDETDKQKTPMLWVQLLIFLKKSSFKNIKQIAHSQNRGVSPRGGMMYCLGNSSLHINKDASKTYLLQCRTGFKKLFTAGF